MDVYGDPDDHDDSSWTSQWKTTKQQNYRQTNDKSMVVFFHCLLVATLVVSIGNEKKISIVSILGFFFFPPLQWSKNDSYISLKLKKLTKKKSSMEAFGQIRMMMIKIKIKIIISTTTTTKILFDVCVLHTHTHHITR